MTPPRKRAATPAAKKAAAPRATATRKTAAPAARKTAAKKTTAKTTAAPAPRRRAPAKKAAAPLRVVRPGEKPPPDTTPTSPTMLTIVEAAEANDERALLVALRKKIAQTIQDSSTPARDQASLSIRLMQINRDIQAIDARAKEEGEDAGEAEDEAFDPEAL